MINFHLLGELEASSLLVACELDVSWRFK